MIHFRINAAIGIGHVHVQCLSANDPQATHALNGELTFTREEWRALMAILVRFPALFELVIGQ